MNQKRNTKDKHIEIHELFNVGNSRYEKRTWSFLLKHLLAKYFHTRQSLSNISYLELIVGYDLQINNINVKKQNDGF